MSEFTDSTPCPIRRRPQLQGIAISQFPAMNSFEKVAFAEPVKTVVPEAVLLKVSSGATPRRRKITTRSTEIVQIYEDHEGTEAPCGRAKPTVARQNRDLAGALPKRPRRQLVCIPTEEFFNETLRLETNDDPTKGGRGITKQGRRAGDGVLKGSTADAKTIAASQKRVPLQLSCRILQANGVFTDHAGTNTGKENIPPGRQMISACKNVKSHHEKRCRTDQLKHAILSKIYSSSCNHNAMARKSNSRSTQTPPSLPIAKKSVIRNAVLLDQISKTKLPLETGESQQLGLLTNQGILKAVKSTARSLPNFGNTTASKPTSHTLLSENISQPHMFEDKWLSHQESIMTKLANQVLRIGHRPFCTMKQTNKDALRKDMMKLYQTESMSLLYKKLQASLSCGALSQPKGSSLNISQLLFDVGMRLQFVELWTKTYSTDILELAAEIVVNRKIPSQQKFDRLSKTESTATGKGSRRILVPFIEKFLLQNEDAQCRRDLEIASLSVGCGLDGLGTTTKASLWCWRRTMQRCLMLIILIDKAKELNIIQTNVFRKSSSIKSSSAVIIRLAALLMPWIGDVSRPLSYIDYHVTHKQLPLAEYAFVIKNPATDLRDGIRLTRIIELLLDSTTDSLSLNADNAIGLLLGEVLPTRAQEQSYLLLSQSLKYPCQEKKSRLFNVQIALEALRRMEGIASMVQDVQPEDIVDGHREKTLKLLWGLVGNLGLELLIDWRDLNWEIRRQQRKAKQEDPGMANGALDDNVNNPIVDRPYAYLLEVWAKSVSWNHGLRGSGLTASFAGGKIFESIVDEYSAYVRPRSILPAEIAYIKLSLKGKLKRLGCSATFGKLSLRLYLMPLILKSFGENA